MTGDASAPLWMPFDAADQDTLVAALERLYRYTRNPRLRRLVQQARRARTFDQWRSATQPSDPQLPLQSSSPRESTGEAGDSATKVETSPTPSAGSTTPATVSAPASPRATSSSTPNALSGQAAFDFYEGIG